MKISAVTILLSALVFVIGYLGLYATNQIPGSPGRSTEGTFNQFDVNQPTSITIDANQRAIISTARIDDVKRDASGDVSGDASKVDDRDAPNAGPGKTRYVICSEPSPDALVARAASLASSLSGQALDEVQFGILLEQITKEDVSKLGNRSDTIQLLRDGLFRACEAYQNQAIDEIEYSVLSNKYANIMVTLLAIEELTSGVLSVNDPASGPAPDSGAKRGARSPSPDENEEQLTANEGSVEQANQAGQIKAADAAALNIQIVQTVEKLVGSIVREENESFTARRCLTFLTSGDDDDRKADVKSFCLKWLAQAQRESEVFGSTEGTLPGGSGSPGLPEFTADTPTTQIGPGETRRVTLTRQRPREWLAFNLVRRGKYVVTATSPSGSTDPSIALYSKQGGQAVLIAENDDVNDAGFEAFLGIGGLDSFIIEDLEGGEYLLAVPWLPRSGGRIDVAVRPSSAVIDEVGEEAEELLVGPDWTEIVFDRTRRDGWLRLKIRERGNFEFMARSVSNDTVLQLFGRLGDEPILLGENDDHGGDDAGNGTETLGANGSRLVAPLNPGRYLIRVSDLRGSIGIAEVRVIRRQTSPRGPVQDERREGPSAGDDDSGTLPE